MATEYGNNQGGVAALASGTPNNPQQGVRPIGWNKLDPENVPALVADQQIITPGGGVVGGGGGSSVWAYRPYGANVADVGFANAFQEVIEVPFDPGTVVEVSCELLNDLSTDTGSGAGAGNGNGRYSLVDIRFSSGSAFTDANAKAFDGVTAASFVDVSRSGSYSSVDGNGPSPMVMFVPASPAVHSTSGQLGYGYTPPVLLELQPRRDGRPGSVIYIQGRVGAGGGAHSQHARGIVQAAGAGMHTLDVPFRRRGYRASTYDALNLIDWDAATDTSSEFFVFSLRIRAAQKSFVIGNCGDSTQQGVNTPGSTLNATHQTVHALNASKALGAAWGYLSFAQGSTVPIYFHNLLKDQLLRSRNLPDIVFVEVHSQNVSAQTEAAPFSDIGIKNDWQRVLGLIELGQRLGVIVVPTTQPPTSYIQDIYLLGGANQATALAMEANRVKLNGWIRASGSPYLDVSTLVDGGAYANGIRYLLGYTGTGDGYHPNQAAHALVSAEQQRMVLSLLASARAKGAGSKPPYLVPYAPTADGTKTVFAVPHGLGVVPTKADAVARNALTVSQPFATTADINQVYMTYSTAPAAGALSFLVEVQP